MAIVIELFGPPHLISDGNRVLLSSKKVMALLAFLAMRAGQPVSRSHVAGLLWTDVPEEQARNNLRQALSQLRKTFREAGADPIDASTQDIVLRSEDVEIPAVLVSNNLGAEALVKAANGPGFLEGLSTRAAEFDTWILTERQSLEARICRALDDCVASLVAKGQFALAAEALSACLRLDPLNEGTHRKLMKILAKQEKPDAALAQFEACREMLKQSLGVEPSVETRNLAQAIRKERQNGKAQADHEAPSLTQVGAQNMKPELFSSLDAALSAGLDRFADNMNGKWLVTLGEPEPAQLASLPGAGVFLDAAHAEAFGQETAFSLEKFPAEPGLRRVSPVERNRMMVSATTEIPLKRIQEVLSIVVLPFRDMSKKAQELSLGLLLAEEVSACLARFWQLTVASPSAAMTCQRLGLSHDEIHERLGVNFAAEGSVFRLNDELKLSLKITNLKTGEIIASEQFAGSFDEIFEYQSDLVDKIATCISRKTETFVEKEARQSLTNDVGAFDWYLRGLSNYRKAGVDLSFARQAVSGFNNALLLDPEFVRSTALRACAISWYDGDYIESGQAMADMRNALTVTEEDPEVHRITGSLSMMSGDFEAGLAHAERAIQMNPSDAYLLGQSAIYWSWYGDPDKAIPIMERAMTLDPFLPVWAVEDHGVILYSKGDYEEAIASLERLPLRQPRGLAFKAASQLATDDIDGARKTVAEIKRYTPDYSADQLKLVTFYRDPAQTTALFDRLAQAGLN